MRSRQHASPPPRRRSAAEWARLVSDLRQGSLSPEDFATSRGVPLARLRWWRWHLGGTESPRAKADDMRLVPVVVEPSPPPVAASPSALQAPATPAWELCTASGDVLRVYRATAPAELQLALTALVRRGGPR